MKTYKKHLQSVLAVFVLLFVLPVGIVTAQTEGSATTQTEELDEIVGELSISQYASGPTAPVMVFSSKKSCFSHAANVSAIAAIANILIAFFISLLLLESNKIISMVLGLRTQPHSRSSLPKSYVF